MAFNEIQNKRIKLVMDRYLEKKRPPIEIRDEVDISYRIENQSIYIYEIRPQWDDKTKITNIDVAKTTYVESKNNWKIFWMRSDLKWHMYEPHPIVDDIEEFIEIVEKDEYCCFWG